MLPRACLWVDLPIRFGYIFRWIHHAVDTVGKGGAGLLTSAGLFVPVLGGEQEAWDPGNSGI